MGEMLFAMERAKDVRLAIFDVDGVLTDGRLLFLPDGQEIKAFNAQDGHGLKMLAASGVRLAIISGRESPAVTHRAKSLGFDFLYQNVHDKGAVFDELLRLTGIDAGQVAYIGDDVIDLPIMRRAGLAASVPNGVELARRHAHYVTAARGGEGAAREFCEFIMRAQGTLDAQLARYLA